ncbi:tRNA (guanine(37)-N(1))-methyltransferase 1-like isoform X1 [Silene latifolia]|uniref:tRNA (guanine(37)-N(1))-methyltransferase 1-like isoform X1 n=1 Tax=Silene latifolia TaxID=37657 RepID=UPI003D772CE8
MLSKLMVIRHQTLTLSQTHFPKFILYTPSLSSLLHTTAAAATTTVYCHRSPATTAAAATYGPSLRKGISPLTSCKTPFIDSTPQFVNEGENEEKVAPFDEGQFTRVYEISAIRVPSDNCYEIENRIRGHLLNWPRVSNIARVPGDEVDEEVVDLIRVGKDVEGGEEDGVEKAVSRRLYGKAEGDGDELSEVLYRDKLANEFNAKGFMKFRNLAKISRPTKRKKKKEKEGEGSDVEGEKGTGMERRRRNIAVEVLEEGANVGDGDDMSTLLGEEFKGRKWRGSTRLLLLDEKYAGRKIDELPEAVKALLNDCSNEDLKSCFELVRCNLTLFYDYWPGDEILSALLPKDMIILSAFESVGHVAHLNLKDEHLPFKRAIAKVVLDKNKPKIQTVVNKIEAISNHYRTMQLEVLAGNHSLATTVIENGLRFQLDLATVYWNSRLATERQRLVNSFTSSDVLCDVFSGVGPIAISAAKKVKGVYANDLNPNAVDYLERNCVLNKLGSKIKVYNMDGRRFIETVFSNNNAHSITQVVMNLPNDAVEFLGAFRGIFENKPSDRKLTFPTIHVYRFSSAEDPEFDFHERVRVALGEAAFSVEMRHVRRVAPRKLMLCASFVLPRKVAFSKDSIHDT